MRGRSPTRVGQAHLANQLDDFRRHGRSTLRMATLPAPVEPKSSSVPSDHRFRFDDHEGRSPAVPELREPYPERAVCDAQLQFVGTLRAPKDQELMAEGHDLHMECDAGSEALPNGMKHREDDR